MLEIRSLSGGYPGKEILHDVSMTVPQGKITALLGPNGCGKSTLLKMLCGILSPNRGEVLFCREDILALPQNRLAQKVAYLAQDKPVPDICVQRMVLHGRFPFLSYPRRYRKQDYAVVEQVLAQMGISELANMAMNQLSGGQRQQVYIAMALAQETPIILLDEPTTYLDIHHQLRLMRQARELTVQGKTVLMIIHDLSHALEMADQIVLMDHGEIVIQGTPDHIYESGHLDKVFRVRLNRLETPNGWHYYCEEQCR